MDRGPGWIGVRQAAAAVSSHYPNEPPAPTGRPTDDLQGVGDEESGIIITGPPHQPRSGPNDHSSGWAVQPAGTIWRINRY
jgi:hypothetical protein